jgi:hypothetical protein
VHEVAIAPPELKSEAYIRRIVAHHVTPREAGRVFAKAKPKLVFAGSTKPRRYDRVAEAAAPVLDRLCRKASWPSDLMVPAGDHMEIRESSNVLLNSKVFELRASFQFFSQSDGLRTSSGPGIA